MKMIKYFGLMGAIALTSAIGFTACSSSDDVADNVNPTYDGTSVRTDFAFNVTKASQDTRMSGDNVQEGTSVTFLGMKDMYLLPFTLETNQQPAAGSTTNFPTTSSIKNYFLGTLAGITEAQSSKVYSLTFPVGTNNFLFYGKADNSTVTEAFKKGKVSTSLTEGGDPKGSTIDNTNGIYFGLTSIATSLDKDATIKDATKIETYLTDIANATYNDGTTNHTWAGTVTTAQTDGTYSAIALLYTKFTTNITQYAGSKEAVERLVFDLYKTAYAINAQSSVTIVKEIAKAICEKIENTDGTVTLEVKASKDANAADILIANLTSTDISEADNWVATLKGTYKDETNNKYFPAYLGLPMGAAQLTWNDDDGFKYKLDGFDNPSTNIGTETTARIDHYRYPSEIIYFDNSPLRATDVYKTANDFPSTTGTWDTENATSAATGFTSDWDKKVVSSTTRAVAMTNNVNYGVALLQTTVKLKETSLTDNMAAIIGGKATNQTIEAVTNDEDKSIADKKSIFKVTGVLVGGQPSQVGWNMISSTTDYNSVIYDHDVTFTGPLSKTSDNTKNYTVVFDNYDPDGQKDVLIALEIVNDGCDFYGAEGLIPAGNTFYLLGKLQLTHSTNNWSGENAVKANRPTSYRITNESTKRVFVQDYKTIANLTLKDDALKRAYSAIPDLRATEVLFGLSVDLKWVSGLQFNVEM